MARIELNSNQLRLIQRALDFYPRVGIGQFEVIKEHPTFERHLSNKLKLMNGKTDYNRFHQVRDSVEKDLQNKYECYSIIYM